MSASTARTPTGGACAAWSVAAFDKFPELGLEGCVGCIEHLAAGNDDEVQPAFRFVVAKQFTDEAFGSIPDDRRAQLACGGNPEACRGPAIGPYEQGHPPPGYPGPALVDSLEVSARADVLLRAKRGHVRTPGLALPLVGHGQPLATLGPAALQHLPAVLGRHADQEPVGLCPPAVIRLERSLALLRSRHSAPHFTRVEHTIGPKSPRSCPFPRGSPGHSTDHTTSAEGVICPRTNL